MSYFFLKEKSRNHECGICEFIIIRIILPILLTAGFFVWINVQAAEPIEANDLAIWHFDETGGQTAYDATSNHHDLTWYYNPYGKGKIIPDRVEGKWDLGINFNQAEEFYGLDLSPKVDWTNGLTIGGWIKTDLDSFDSIQFFWLGEEIINQLPKNSIVLSVREGKAVINLKQDNRWPVDLESNVLINNNQWHFIVARFNLSNNSVTLFVDGEKQDEVNFTPPIPALEVLTIGKRFNPWAEYTYNFRGAIDDFWLKAESLSDVEVNQFYQSSLPYKADIIDLEPASVETKAYWPFDEGFGSLAFDASSNNFDLSWGFNPWAGGQSTPRWISGKFGNGVNFNKVEDLFSRTNEPAIDFPWGVVVGAWIKTSSSSAEPARFFVWGSDSQNYVLANNLVLSEKEGKASLSLNYYDGYATTSSGPKNYYRNYGLDSIKLINDNNWHLVTVVLDPRPYNHSAKLYIDGELDNEMFFPSPLPLAQEMKVGYRENYHAGSQANFAGDVDDLFILSSIISAQEVKQIYQTNAAFAWPPVKKKDPVIIVPGIMGSWNVLGKWELDPILHIYDNLWEALKLAGYEEGKNLFAFPYQWRLSNVYTAGLLKDKIADIKSICQCDKVDIVAHSMGGLVARAYVESDDYIGDIDQLIFLAVPHRGATKAYLTWEAGELGQTARDFILERILTVEADFNGYGSLFSYIRNLPIQSVQELLPIYDYLRDKDSMELRVYPNNYPANSFLELLNNSSQLQKLNNINMVNILANAGNQSTVNSFRVIDKEFIDGEWEHGYPENYDTPFTDHGLEYGIGDDTVPERSNKDFMGLENITINSNHNTIVTDGQMLVIKELTGVEPTEEVRLNLFQKFFMVRIFSPADFVIIDPDGKRLGKDFASGKVINEINGAFYTDFDTDIEFAVIPGPIGGEYRVELRGTDEGEYKLSTSFIDDEKGIDKEFSGSIEAGQERNFTIIYTEQAEDPISELEPEDTTPPIITINTPQLNQQYLRSQDLIIDYTATDDFSGLAATTTMIDGNILPSTIVDLFDYAIGMHPLTITAVDKKGNSSQAQVSFEIIANIESIITDIQEIYNRGWLKGGVAKALLVNSFKLLDIENKYLDRQIKEQQKLIEKIQNNSNLKPEVKQKLIDQYNKKIATLTKNRQKTINLSLDLIKKLLDIAKKQNVINQQAYDIIINDINYLRINL